MKNSRIFNGILMIVFLLLTLALPLRGLISSGTPAANAAGRGTPVFNAEDVNSGAQSANWIMLCLFGSLTLVFGWRMLKPPVPPAVKEEK